MNYDDIFVPAVEGDIDLLRERLEMGEVDLNERIDCGESNGKRTEIPLLFSIINSMLDNGAVNYEVLELLYEYGINLDGSVKLTDESSVMDIPILVYCLAQWQDFDLLKFFLNHGAYTDAYRTTSYAIGAKEKLNLLYFAITNCEGTAELEQLLLHGADPDACNLIYAQDEAVQQWLPALYYTTVVEGSVAKTAALIKFGASFSAKVDTGIGWRHQFAISDYLSEVYPGAANILWQANRTVVHGSFKAIRKSYVPGPKPKLKKNETAETQVNNEPAANTSVKKNVNDVKNDAPGDEYSVIRRLGKSLIDYDYAKAGEFNKYDSSRKPDHTSFAFPIIGLIAAGFVLLNAVVFKAFEISWVILMVAMFGIYIFLLSRRKQLASERGAKADRIRAERARMVGELSRAAEGKDVTSWWKAADGFNITSKEIYRLLVWTSFDRVYDNSANNGIALKGYCGVNDPIKGSSVMKMVGNKDYRVLINNGLTADKNYKIAELCFWTLLDGTTVYREGMSEAEIKRDMAEFNARQDEKERIRNFYEHRCIDMTDEDRYWFSDMSYTDLMESKLAREIRTEAYEKKLKNVSYTVIEDKYKYYHFLEPVGVVIFNDDDSIAGILVYRKNFHKERYETDNNKMIYDMADSETSFNLAELDMDIIRNLRYYPIEMPDLASRKPDTFTDAEWAELIYASAYNGKIMNAVRNEYASVQEKKMKTIAANTSLLR